MSHFTVLILMDKTTEDVEAEITKLLAPYDENMEVEEYVEDCYCVDDVAKTGAREAAEKVCGPFKDIRDKYWKLSEDERTEEKWKELTGEYGRIEGEAFENHSMREKPNPKCGFYTKDYCPNGCVMGARFEDGSGCGGLGRQKSTYNPKSKWDWYALGGRWDGDIQGRAEEFKTDDGFNFHSPRDVSENSMLIADMKEPYIPFAIVTPDGEWHQKAEMHWWAITTDEDDTWEDKAKRILESHNDKRAVLIDCHI